MQLVDGRGKIRESYGFDEFGLSMAASPAAANGEWPAGRECLSQSGLQPFGYTGYQPEAVGGLYYAQARRYDMGAGRFISEDGIAGFAMVPYTLNRYGYCWNNPMNYVDLDGKWPTIVIGALIGLAITGGVELFSQVKENGWDNVNWSKVAVKAGEGALSGALMGSGVGIGVEVAGNIAISATSSVAFKSHTVENVLFNIVKTTTRQMAPSSSAIVRSMLVGTVKMLLTTIAINEKGDDGECSIME